VRAKSLRGSSSDLTVAPLTTAAGLALPEDEPSDGRAARSYRTRQAIIDAMRALHAEGDLRPTAPRIAARAGVSLRTVWQQFTDKEELLAEAVRRDLEILLSLVEKIEPDQPLDARIETFVSQRTRVLENMTPSWRAARVHEPFSAQLRRNKLRMIARARAEVEKVFAPELVRLCGQKRQQLLESLHAISLWEFWESLRSDLGLGPQQARELLSTTFTTLLAQAAAA
jgi:TetR/AcrR family transcriptional regulator, regulator of autoinduction and epiphytic fitness